MNLLYLCPVCLWYVLVKVLYNGHTHNFCKRYCIKFRHGHAARLCYSSLTADALTTKVIKKIRCFDFSYSLK